ncbi:MAG: acetylxylan esterase [Pirellulaceae bacterium]|nr:acetylxylan esterase [Pirellulaceae bacterium]
MFRCFVTVVIAFVAQWAVAQVPRALPDGQQPNDGRLGELRTLNSYFPFKPVETIEDWEQRKAAIKRRLLISQGLWPQPTKSDLNVVVHGEVEYDDYSIAKVYFQSIPGHYVTGSLYRPKGKDGPFPVVLCPHGHWRDARFYDAGLPAAKNSVAIGAERYLNAARNPLQARCVQLARMGCIAFFYDMTGNCDSIQLGHRPDQCNIPDTDDSWGFFGTQAELRLQNMMGLQTWNSVRSIDFLLEQPDVDPSRIGVTGASGGGTQSMIIAAIDDRVTAAMPCVMVSTSMQGGCTCENAPLMRIDQGNIDIAAAIAPRPLGLTAADDWTKELETKGYPELRNLYAMLGKKDHLTAAFHTHFKHNYNHVNRTVMYGFFNRHFKLGLDEPVLERDFTLCGKHELSVWNDDHPGPTAVGDSHEVAILKLAADESQRAMSDLIPDDRQSWAEFQSIVGDAWNTILGRRLTDVGDVRFTQSGVVQHDRYDVTVGRLDHSDAGEQIPAMQVAPKTGNRKGVIVWLTASGKNGLIHGDQVVANALKQLDNGFTIVTADLFGQGEFLVDGRPLESQRMWYQQNNTKCWHRFAGYTYGYNHPLFVQRVHDVLSLVKYAQSIAADQPIHLVGLDGVVGPIAVAARSQMGPVVDQTIVDLDGFRFHRVDKVDDPMFVPGGVKYLDVDALIGLCAPHRVSLHGLAEPGMASRIYQAADAAEKLVLRRTPNSFDWVGE